MTGDSIEAFSEQFDPVLLVFVVLLPSQSELLVCLSPVVNLRVVA